MFYWTLIFPKNFIDLNILQLFINTFILVLLTSFVLLIFSFLSNYGNRVTRSKFLQHMSTFSITGYFIVDFFQENNEQFTPKLQISERNSHFKLSKVEASQIFKLSNYSNFQAFKLLKIETISNFQPFIFQTFLTFKVWRSLIFMHSGTAGSLGPQEPHRTAIRPTSYPTDQLSDRSAIRPTSYRTDQPAIRPIC